MKPLRILISGAGIAGIALARRFEQLAIEYTIIEKHSKPSNNSLGIGLPFNAIQALRKLDLAEKVLACSHQVNKITYAKKNGEIISQGDLTDAPLNQDKFVAMYRHKLQDILLSSINTKIHYKTIITDFKNTSDGVEVVCSNEKLNGNYDLVVSAEGVHSELRERCFPTENTVVNYAIQNWRFIHTIKNHCLQPTYYFANSEMFMVYPLDSDTLYCYGHVYDKNNRYNNKNSHSNLTEVFGTFGGVVPDIINNINDDKIYDGRLKSVSKPYYSDNRIVFVGDSGNACSPLLQQGAASAFEDILCLAEQVELYSIDKAISQYKSIRFPRVEWIVKKSDAPIKQVKLLNNPITTSIRNYIFKSKGPLNINGWKYLANM